METPVKAVEIFCFICTNKTKRLFCMSKHKAVNENFLYWIEKCLEISVDTNMLQHMYVCERCIKTCKSYYLFKESGIENYGKFNKRHVRMKRLATTPPSRLREKESIAQKLIKSVEKASTTSPAKCLKESVAEKLLRSVEKMSKLGINDAPQTCDTESPISPLYIATPIDMIDKELHADDSMNSVLIDHGYCSSRKKYNPFHSIHVSLDHQYSGSSKVSNLTSSSIQKSFSVKDLLSLSVNKSSVSVAIDKQLAQLSKLGHSIAFDNNPEELSNRNWFKDLVEEMKISCPELLEILLCAVGDKVDEESKLATVGTIYGIILNCRNKKASAVQRLYTALSIKFHADNKLLKRFQRSHITLSDESKRHLMNQFAEFSSNNLIKKISSGTDGKINGDNLDIYVTTNDIRMDNKNKDYHFFASDWTADRVELKDLDDTKSIIEDKEITLKLFTLNDDEKNLYKAAIKNLLGKITAQYIEGFEWFDSVIPDHMPHRLEDTMKLKSEIFWLKILLKNEACYSDCIQIMDEYEKQLREWYTKAGRGGDLENLEVPVGGDQLTRVRLQGAKALRNGSLTAEERLEHLTPIIVEMFHTLQDFLEKLYKRFYKTSSGRDKGTLYHLKVLIQRSNVNGNVKSRFEAHEDFVLTVGCAYWLSYVQKMFHMEELGDQPQHEKLSGKQIKMMHYDKKKKLYDDIMDEMVDPLIQIYSHENKPVSLSVKIGNNQYIVECQLQENIYAFNVQIGNVIYRINVKHDEAKNGAKIPIKTSTGATFNIEISIMKQPEDDLYSYVMQFMQWYFLILNFIDAVREGDIFRNNINLKFCIPVFFSHSALSKYFIECIDYILKTEALLTEKMALKVRCASFVNPKGKQGKNKAADLQKENQVLVLKDLIRGLGSNKTENAIVTVSKAAPVLENIVQNFDEMVNVKNKQTNHKKRSFEEDVKVIMREVKSLNVFTFTNGRTLTNFRGISKSPFDFTKSEFERSVMTCVNRLKRGIPVREQVDSDEESS